MRESLIYAVCAAILLGTWTVPWSTEADWHRYHDAFSIAMVLFLSIRSLHHSIRETLHA